MTETIRQIDVLRARIRRLEGIGREGGGTVLPLGLSAVDRALPEGGLPLGTVHEIRGDAGPVTGFTALLMGRIAGRRHPVLWLDAADEIYSPGLLPYGLDPADLIVAAGITGDRDILWAVEEALAAPALGAVAASLKNPGFTALRRLQLAARDHGTTAFLIRPAAGCVGASVAVTRWHVTAAPGVEEDTPGIGAPRWHLCLEKCRGGREARFLIARTPTGWENSRLQGAPQPETIPAVAAE